LLTGLNFAGGSEFAIIEVWTQPPQLLFLILITFLVNSRHILMGASLAPYIRHLPNRKALPLLFFMCDESWALSITDSHKQNPRNPYAGFSVFFYIGLCFALYVMWVVLPRWESALVLSLVMSQSLVLTWHFPQFFWCFYGMWKGFKPALPWLISLIAAALAYYYLPKGWYVLIGSISGIFAAFY
jgi:predicted branched-subunit amino acid permease